LIEWSQLNGLQQFVIRIPPARFLDIPERLFSLKRFQEDGGVAGFSKERWNRYREIRAVMIRSRFSRFVGLRGG